MPKRTTLTFTSEDAVRSNEGLLYVYYCRYSGKHAFTIDGDINKLPRRRTDGSRIIDTKKYTVKLYTQEGGKKLIKRHNGKIEQQLRLMVDQLPVAYRSEEGGQYIYVLDNSVSTYVGSKKGDRLLVPPCIARNSSGQTQVKVEIEDRAQRQALVRINADGVRVHTTTNVGQDGATEEILQLFAKLLGARLTQLQLKKSEQKHGGGRSRILVVDHLSPQEVFEKLQHGLSSEDVVRRRHD